MLAALMTFATYVMGHLTWSLLLLRDKLESAPAIWLCDAMYWIMPNFDRLNVKAAVVHGRPLDPGYLTFGVIYGMTYALVVLALACLAFERKEFN